MTGGPRLCVIGYASVDHKFRTDPFAGAGRTTLIRESPSGRGPQPGAVSYFAREAARHGVAVDVVSWVGADPLGDLFCASLRDAGVGTAGVDRQGSRSPSTHMFYPAHGEPVTFFDAGDAASTLTETQRDVVRDADIVVAMIAPPHAVEAALDAVRTDALVGWVVKADPGSLPGPLARRLAERTQVVSYSAAESEFLRTHCGVEPADLAGSRSHRLVAETHGSHGVAYTRGDGWERVPPERHVRTDDVTGAGDTFAASLIARYGRADGGDERIDRVVADACSDAAEFLAGREKKGTDEQ